MSKHRNTQQDTNPYTQYPTQTQPKKKHTGRKIIGGIAAVAIIGGIAAAATSGTDTSTDTDTSTTTGDQGHTITYQAETSDGSTASITYVGADMNITQQQDQPTPWTVDIPNIGNKWDVIGANISVQQNGSSNVTCRVLWDGETVNENTSSGPYSIATCNLPNDL